MYSVFTWMALKAQTLYSLGRVPCGHIDNTKLHQITVCSHLGQWKHLPHKHHLGMVLWSQNILLTVSSIYSFRHCISQSRGPFLNEGRKSMVISLVIVCCKMTWFTKNVCGMQFVFQIVCQQVMKEVTVLFLRGNFLHPSTTRLLCANNEFETCCVEISDMDNIQLIQKTQLDNKWNIWKSSWVHCFIDSMTKPVDCLDNGTDMSLTYIFHFET